MRGLVLDFKARTLHWYDAVSNLCGDDGSSFEQSLDAFLTQGVPPIVHGVPAAVLAEVRTALQANSNHLDAAP